MFVFNRSHPVLFAVIYRPPKYNKDFLSDFTDLLSGLMPKYDRVLIVCPLFAAMLCQWSKICYRIVIDSFNLVQSITYL